MPDSIRGNLADRDHEIDDPIFWQACGPGLFFRQGAYLRQIRGVDERHGISTGEDRASGVVGTEVAGAAAAAWVGVLASLGARPETSARAHATGFARLD